MRTLKAKLGYLVADQSGATSIEYALIALLVAVPTVAAFTLLGTNVAKVINLAAAGFN